MNDRNKRRLRFAVPVVGSIAVLAWVLSRLDLQGVGDKLTLDVLVHLAPVFVAYGCVSLWCEALSLSRAARAAGATASLWTWARIKAASYPLNLIHYTIGLAGLSYLLQKRTGLELERATGAVLLVSVLDLVVVLGFVTIGAGLLGADGVGLQFGVVAFVGFGAILGFALLRTERSLGPIDVLRDRPALQPAREAPLRTLLELIALRIVFITCFIGLGGVALREFGVVAPLSAVAFGIALASLVAVLPIAVSGAGTVQLAFIWAFGRYASDEAAFTASIALSIGLIVLRSGLGLIFAREYTREAFSAARAEAEVGDS